MAKQQTSSRDFRPVVAVVLIAIGLVILLGVDDPTADFNQWVGAVVGDGLGLLRCVAPLAWHALQSLAFEHQSLASYPLQAVMACGPALLAVAGIA